MEQGFDITGLNVNGMPRPLGTDQIPPVFGWQMEAEGNDRFQKAYQIIVKEEQGGEVLWDTGRIETPVSNAIRYQGDELKPCTRYIWEVSVWNESDNCLRKTSWFETGLLSTARDSWDGAQFISTPGQELCSQTKGVFCIEAEIKIPEGSSRGGIIFGKNDQRLLDDTKNVYGVKGENYISYELDVQKHPAMLHIYRVGYTNEDSREVPYASVPVADINSKKAIITEANCHEYHKLKVEVYGNHARAFVDGICIDEVTYELPFPTEEGKIHTRGRTLNLLGHNDVITFPRLNEVGFTAENGELHIRKFIIRNIRTPKAELIDLSDRQEYAFFEKKLLDAGLIKEEGCYAVKTDKRCQVTASPDYGAIPMLRRTFQTAGKRLLKARLYVTARGIYEGEVNGRKLSEEFFCPGASQFDKHLYYQTYDLTEDIRAGKNAVGFYTASGWWSDSQTFTLMNHNYFGDKPSLMAKVQMWYEDGTTETIVTDADTWKCTKEGPVTYAGFFNGEHYDAGKASAFAEYSMPEYDDSNWCMAVEKPLVKFEESDRNMNWPQPNETEPKFVGQPEKGVRAAEFITAKERMEPRPGIYIYDMGQNMAGVPRLTFTGSRGQKITIRYAEVLYPKLDEYKSLDGLILTENLRDADCTDVYICSGDGAETYMPRFTFHGYRYVEITGIKKPLPLEAVQGVVLSSISESGGNIETSDQSINRLFENIRWSQRANFISIPTDCPQRNERMGWLGDAQVFARTSLYNADLRLFFKRFLQSVRDLQLDSGQFQDIAPVGGGFGGIAWGCAGIIIPWELYLQYGDGEILEENCEAMLSYGQYLNAHRKDDLVEDVGFLGDWLATEANTDKPLLWDSIYAYVLKLLYKSMEVLGRAEAKEYHSLYEKTKLAWNKTYIDAKTGKTCSKTGAINDTQCSYALPLAYGIVSEDNAKMAAEYLNRKTIEVGYTLTTGFLGTGAISEALCQGGYADTAYQLLKQKKYPSWLYSVTQGATTIWERWNSYTNDRGFGGNNAMNSFNHYSLGAVGAWMYSHMLGIRRSEACPGFQKFILQPDFGSLEYAKGYYVSCYGKIESAWSRTGNKIRYQVTVPANTAAEIRLPDGVIKHLQSGRYEFIVKNKC